MVFLCLIGNIETPYTPCPRYDFRNNITLKDRLVAAHGIFSPICPDGTKIKEIFAVRLPGKWVWRVQYIATTIKKCPEFEEPLRKVFCLKPKNTTIVKYKTIDNFISELEIDYFVKCSCHPLEDLSKFFSPRRYIQICNRGLKKYIKY